MRLLGSRSEMQQIDAYSIEQMGIPGIVLMERAALAMEEEILRRFPSPGKVVVVAEKGNNGGDGLALGRMLLSRGFAVDFYEIGGVRHASESYQMQKKILENMGVSFCERLPEYPVDIWIDAVFGVGLTRDVAGMQREVLETMNQREGYKIAVDTPSGVDASTGHILGCAFRADLTITFGLSKVGLVLYPGASVSGEVVVKDIGFPKQAVEAVGPKACTYTREDLTRLPARTAWSNKGSYGRVLLIVGAKNMAGAAWLSASAAYRTGSGLVRIFTCEENREILQTRIPEAIMTTWRSEQEALDELPGALAWADVVGIGPGLGETMLTRRMLEIVLAQGNGPLVIDADGINSLSALKREKSTEESVDAHDGDIIGENISRDLPNDKTGRDIDRLYEDYSGEIILTPHLKEMERFTGISVEYIREHLPEVALDAADENHVIVLKDARTVVSDGLFPTYINTSGNHGMSTGGSGDVLTGIICGLLAGGLSAAEAARLGVYCHGLAGDAAAKQKGCYGLMAGDLIQNLNQVIH